MNRTISIYLVEDKVTVNQSLEVFEKGQNKYESGYIKKVLQNEKESPFREETKLTLNCNYFVYYSIIEYLIRGKEIIDFSFRENTMN